MYLMISLMFSDLVNMSAGFCVPFTFLYLSSPFSLFSWTQSCPTSSSLAHLILLLSHPPPSSCTPLSFSLFLANNEITARVTDRQLEDSLKVYHLHYPEHQNCIVVLDNVHFSPIQANTSGQFSIYLVNAEKHVNRNIVKWHTKGGMRWGRSEIRIIIYQCTEMYTSYYVVE